MDDDWKPDKIGSLALVPLLLIIEIPYSPNNDANNNKEFSGRHFIPCLSDSLLERVTTLSNANHT